MNIPIGMLYTFGDLKCETIFEQICTIVGNHQDITLNIAKTTASILFCNEKVFSIRINSKTACLDTEEKCVFQYVPRIVGAKICSGATRTYAQIPLITTEESISFIREMLCELFQECFNRQNVESFGCCNDHVRCSDARGCLHQEDRFYLGCIYRKNLEEGRIFYGKNRNVEESRP